MGQGRPRAERGGAERGAARRDPPAPGGAAGIAGEGRGGGAPVAGGGAGGLPARQRQPGSLSPQARVERGQQQAGQQMGGEEHAQPAQQRDKPKTGMRGDEVRSGALPGHGAAFTL